MVIILSAALIIGSIGIYGSADNEPEITEESLLTDALLGAGAPIEFIDTLLDFVLFYQLSDLDLFSGYLENEDVPLPFIDMMLYFMIEKFPTMDEMFLLSMARFMTDNEENYEDVLGVIEGTVAVYVQCLEEIVGSNELLGLHLNEYDVVCFEINNEEIEVYDSFMLLIPSFIAYYSEITDDLMLDIWDKTHGDGSLVRLKSAHTG